ncbi:MAG: thioredoxin-like protein [Olpidium bornovanus]|uniref:Thioredoxin-like protein n=1 Tax=Olpidium bornovanus TaxID=278681 RepID=A0A8H8DGD3_9FUNG|nr:MAG: thioredoxin-like protein [Olpidium bornovanus]
MKPPMHLAMLFSDQTERGERGANSATMEDPNADTEWNDILRNHGILPPKEKQLTEEDIADVVLEVQKEEASRLQDAGIDEIDALLEEELDDDRRIEEMRQAVAKEKFGFVTEISEKDFVKEVTEASKDAPVVVHLYQSSIVACRILNERLSALAKKYRSTKFAKIVASKCIHGYPDHNCPTMLVPGKIARFTWRHDVAARRGGRRRRHVVDWETCEAIFGFWKKDS